MGGKSIVTLQKQERNMRTRWTPALDKVFADLVVQQIQLGNRPNNFFDKKTWSLIRDEFNKQTSCNFNNNQLRKHLQVLRMRYLSVKSATNNNGNDFVIGDSYNIDYKLWDDDFEAQSQLEPNKVKESPIFEQLCTIFAETVTEGEYAQSSHYEELDKSQPSADQLLINSCPNGENALAYSSSSSMFATPCARSAQNASILERKRKLSSEKNSVPEQAKKDRDVNEIMAKAMLDMLNASTMRNNIKPKQNEKFSITNCVEVLDKIEEEEGVDTSFYFAALDLFEDPNMRETFVSLKSNKVRLAWLLGKCSKAKPSLKL